MYMGKIPLWGWKEFCYIIQLAGGPKILQDVSGLKKYLPCSEAYVSLSRRASKKLLVVILHRRHGVCVTISEGGESKHHAGSMTWCQVTLVL